MLHSNIVLAVLGLSIASPAFAQGTPTTPASPDSHAVATATAKAPTPPPSPLGGIRNKLSAADLPSAESILEVWKEQHGEDGPWLVGLSWLARGALLLGEDGKAKQYAAAVRARCADSLARGVDLSKSQNLEIALGAAIEVEAQLLAKRKGARAATAFLREEISRYPKPLAFRSRLYKRLNMLSMVGTPAPEIAIEDHVGADPPTLASLRGKPVLLFLWAEGCGDCRAQQASLARVKARHAAEGLEVLAVTRYYDEEPKRVAEKARVDSMWKAAYKEMGPTPIILSTPAMETYGVSSTPTFVFVDRKGVVRGYVPYRLTESELDRAIAGILKP